MWHDEWNSYVLGDCRGQLDEIRDNLKKYSRTYHRKQFKAGKWAIFRGETMQPICELQKNLRTDWEGDLILPQKPYPPSVNEVVCSLSIIEDSHFPVETFPVSPLFWCRSLWKFINFTILYRLVRLFDATSRRKRRFTKTSKITQIIRSYTERIDP
jgi:hypothetical protein